jgi:hypothetical protein
MSTRKHIASFATLGVFVFLAAGSLDSNSSGPSSAVSTSGGSSTSDVASAAAAPVDPKVRAETVKGLAGCKPSITKVRRTVSRHPAWSDDVLAAVVCGSAQIGMTKEQAIAAWGRPSSVNRTTYASGTNEQWVYNMTNYLYFDDDRLTSIQN